MIPFVMKEMCETCIFRPGNKMNLADGRLQSMVDDCDKNDTNVICHQSHGLMGKIRHEAWCRGSVDRRAGAAVRLMRQMGILENLDTTIYRRMLDGPLTGDCERGGDEGIEQPDG